MAGQVKILVVAPRDKKTKQKTEALHGLSFPTEVPNELPREGMEGEGKKRNIAPNCQWNQMDLALTLDRVLPETTIRVEVKKPIFYWPI